ncbi:TolC family outer membrane protein [uncultured Candidatus Pelagibacter sp.]|uniref:TolC family outer membrane protein n=1 Tax=uncultured Candidatus Pelagibacter sp. TaxID=372654 RepID=UPI00261195AD|nr:TolC family outer membrane protein [uncultured Candidatus Pelagibacter sp.]
MKKLLIIISLTVFSFSNAMAVTLYDALNQTYQNNIQLNAERENVKVSEEDINISKADYKPTIKLSGSKSIENTNKLTNQSGGDASINDVNPFTTSIKLEQTILDYGRTLAVEKNITALDLAKAKLIKKEQEVLHSAIDAYSNLILAREKLNINRKNLNLLRRQVENDKIRLDRGRITITDLAQSESSFAGAQAQFTQAKSDLLIAKLIYENIIGKISNPNQLQKKTKSIVKIPNSLNEAINLSKQNNPDIKIAKFDLEQSRKDVEISKSDLKPTASLSLERSYSDDLSSTVDQREKDVLKATVSWPFYTGGKTQSTINKKSNLTTRKRLLLDDAVRTNETNVASAWSSLESSRGFLNSVKVQVRAAQIANDGITAEYERGSRTTLDVIQSNSLLLSAQISLASSEKNYLMAQYNLLKAVGLLNSQYLKLK